MMPCIQTVKIYLPLPLLLPLLLPSPSHTAKAGMHAIRENRYVILPKDFEKGYKNNMKKDEQELDFYK